MAWTVKDFTALDVLTAQDLDELYTNMAGLKDGTLFDAGAITAAKIDWASTGAGAGIWWEELDRVSLGSAGNTITSNTFAARKYLRILFAVRADSTGSPTGIQLSFNGDTGNNYTRRSSLNGAAEATQTSQSSSNSGTSFGYLQIATIDVLNVASYEKFFSGNVISGTAGAATVNDYLRWSGKWANTSNQITSLAVSGSNNFAAGSEVVVVGHN